MMAEAKEQAQARHRPPRRTAEVASWTRSSPRVASAATRSSARSPAGRSATWSNEVMKGQMRLAKESRRRSTRASREIDALLSRQLNEIMHHPEFQKLEGLVAGAALPGAAERDQHHAQDPGAQRLQEGPR